MKSAIILLLTLLASSTALANPVYVDDNAPNDPAPGNPLISDPEENGTIAHPFDAIQEAIDYITDPNTQNEIIILPGTYTGNGNRDIDFKGKPIIVRGSEPDDPNVVAATIIDCQGTEAQPHRGFYFHTGETESSVLKGLTITSGYGDKFKLYSFRNTLFSVGGGVFCKECSPKLDRVVITLSGAEIGGAILATHSNIQLLSCRIINNAGDGGGGYFYRGSPALDECLISDNRANYNGGGLLFEEGNPRMTLCKIVKNTALRGGGIFCVETSPSFLNCEISANVAVGASGSFSSGGGVHLFRCASSVDFRNCLITGNHSKSNGGGIYVVTSSPVISNCTLIGNRANQRGGGIFGDDHADVTLSDCILWNNLATEGSQIACPRYNDEWDARELHIRYSNIQGGKEAIEGMWTRIDWQDGNIDTDPLFAHEGNWDGDTWIQGDYHLKSHAGRYDPARQIWQIDDVHSPCIDAGHPAADYSAEPPYNGRRINMGAYGGSQYASRTGNCTAYPLGDLDYDCKVTFKDLAIIASNWLTCNLNPPTACN